MYRVETCATNRCRDFRRSDVGIISGAESEGVEPPSTRVTRMHICKVIANTIAQASSRMLLDRKAERHFTAQAERHVQPRQACRFTLSGYLNQAMER